MAIGCSQIVEKFPDLLEFISGNHQAQAERPCSVEMPAQGGLVFAHKTEHLQACIEAGASVIVVPTKAVDSVKDISFQGAFLASPNLQLAMAKVNQQFFPITVHKQAFSGHAIHPSAIISETAQLGSGVKVGPNAVIGEGAKIGDNTFVGSQVTIEPNAQVGADCHLHPQCFIGHSCIVGDRCEVHPHTTIGCEGYGYAHDKKGNHYRIPHYGRVIIGDSVHIGASVNIDRGVFVDTLVGDGTKVDNHCHLAHNSKVGKNCLITAGFISAGSSSVGDNCVFAGRSSVNGHISVADNCTFVAHSAVTNNITVPGGTYGGYPVVPYKKFLRSQATLVHLPEMRKNIARILKKLGLNN